MNKRLAKKREKIKRKKLHEIYDLVLDINGLGVRTKNDTGNLPTAFMYFNGHVANINVQIHEDGWSSAGSSFVQFDNYGYFDGCIKNEPIEKLLDSLKEEKKKLIPKIGGCK